MKVPFLDLSVKDEALKAELLEAVDRVLSHGRFILGPEHDEFERAVAERCRRRHAVGVGSGSDALFLALRALEIGPGDEVITTPLTWVATTNAIVLNGATPVFVDVRDDLNIDPGLIEAAITKRTKAILPVHFTGQCCDMAAILEVAEKHGVAVIEDAAQAFGATYGGRPAGSFGRLACFSMNPMKVFRGYGEAGAVATDDDALKERLTSLRYAGTVNKEDCHWPSINGRLDTLQAAMLLVNLRHIDGKIEARRRVAESYDRLLDSIVSCPIENPACRHTYYSYTIACDGRDALMAFLLARGVETKIQHPFLMPHHAAYRGKFKASIPVAERLVRRILCIPNHEDMTAEDIAYVAGGIKDYVAGERGGSRSTRGQASDAGGRS